MKAGKEGDSCERTGFKGCASPLVCLFSDKTATKGYCRRPCDPLAPSCPSNRLCVAIPPDKGVCDAPKAGAKAGAACDTKNNKPCEVHLFCVGPGTGAGICRQICSLSAPARKCTLSNGRLGYCKDFTQLGTKFGICLP